MDLFKTWDKDGDGTVSKAELRRACMALDFDAPRAELDAFFESIDADGRRMMPAMVVPAESSLMIVLTPTGALVPDAESRKACMSILEARAVTKLEASVVSTPVCT